MRIFAGAGIVAGSDPEAELAETIAKLVPMRDALGD
jgi:menaquinone-specific isochorismate synthase